MGDRPSYYFVKQLSINLLAFLFVITILLHGMIRGIGRYHKALLILVIIVELFTVYDGAKKGWIRDASYKFDRKESLIESTFKTDDKPFVKTIQEMEATGIDNDGPFRVFDNIYAEWKGVFYAYSSGFEMAFSYQGTMAQKSLIDYQKMIRPGDYTSPLWDLFNVKYLLIKQPSNLPSLLKLKQVRGTVGLYVNPKSFPRTYVMTDYRFFDDKNDLLYAMGDRNNYEELRQSVYLSEEPKKVKINDPEKRGLSRVDIESYGNHNIEISADMATDGYLILADVWSPLWNAYVDGEKVETMVAYNTLRSIELTKGVHKVEFRYNYNYPYILIGKIVPIVTILAICVLLFFRRRQRRRGLQ